MTNLKTAPAVAPEPGSLAERLLAVTAEFRQSAVRLREALVHRRLDDIWQILSQQEQQAVQLEQFGKLWQDLVRAGTQPAGGACDDTRRRVQAALQETREVQRGNVALAQCFLAIVRRALHEAGADSGAELAVYGRTGRRGLMAASRLISRFG